MIRSQISLAILAVVLGLTAVAPKAQALISDPAGTHRKCKKDAVVCTLFITFSFPSFLVGADTASMSEDQRKAFALGEARNYLQAVPGDYLLLKLTARAMGLGTSRAALEKVATEIVSASK